MPHWEAQFWAGDPNTGSIRRNQANEFIQCTDPKMADYVCLSYQDLQKLYDEVLSKCEKWSD